MLDVKMFNVLKPLVQARDLQSFQPSKDSLAEMDLKGPCIKVCCRFNLFIDFIDGFTDYVGIYYR